jgi:hypothetical protein
MTRFFAGPLLALFLSAVCHAAIVAEVEDGGLTNNEISNAEAIDSASFTFPHPLTVFNLPGWVTATIQGSGGVGEDVTDVDFFEFTTPGGQAMFDIDNDPFTFNTILSLFNSDGTLIAFGDDSFHADAGSESADDAFLGVITLSPGTYYIAVSEFGNLPTQAQEDNITSSTPLFRPDSAPGGQAVAVVTEGDSSYPLSGPDGQNEYVLHISLESDTGVVPEPMSLAVWSLLGIVASLGIWRRRRRA